jgi:hypothetical protein
MEQPMHYTRYAELKALKAKLEKFSLKLTASVQAFEERVRQSPFYRRPVTPDRDHARSGGPDAKAGGWSSAR